ncbi:hypothetical protein [Paenibacillus puerhi]|uniref:hypothetical protein n=1 Tax=Paenibacillus puerhi TaxID=2692622 RepID=UPI00135B2A9A|nr:hypothetical protein [Paenibacillus puerhi]
MILSSLRSLSDSMAHWLQRKDAIELKHPWRFTLQAIPFDDSGADIADLNTPLSDSAIAPEIDDFDDLTHILLHVVRLQTEHLFLLYTNTCFYFNKKKSSLEMNCDFISGQFKESDLSQCRPYTEAFPLG